MKSAAQFAHAMNDETTECRTACGACCIAPSISSPIPGMPDGKPAGMRCVQLTSDLRCAIFGRPDRPAVCQRLRPTFSMCGNDATEAIRYLAQLEHETAPNSRKSPATPPIIPTSA